MPRFHGPGGSFSTVGIPADDRVEREGGKGTRAAM